MSFRLLVVLVTVAGSIVPGGAFKANAQDATTTSRAAELLAAGKPVTIVCFGDSITGVYYHSGGWRAYPEMLVRHERHGPGPPRRVQEEHGPDQQEAGRGLFPAPP